MSKVRKGNLWDRHPNIAKPSLGMAKIHEVVECAFLTARVEGVSPVSLILVSTSGAGKSRIIKRYASENRILLVDDLTSTGMWEALQDDKDKTMKFFSNDDMNAMFSHHERTVDLMTSSLTKLMHDGTARVQDGRKWKEAQHGIVGIVGGLITDLFLQHSRSMFTNGMLRTLFPIRFELSEKLVEEIMLRQAEQVRDVEDTVDPLRFSPDDKMEPKRVKLSVKHAKMLIENAKRIVAYAGMFRSWEEYTDDKGVNRKRLVWKQSADKFYPMGTHKMLCAMAKAHALRVGRDKVIAEDVSFTDNLVQLSRMNPPCEVQLDGSIKTPPDTLVSCTVCTDLVAMENISFHMADKHPQHYAKTGAAASQYPSRVN